jgi:hypothetical protein
MKIGLWPKYRLMLQDLVPAAYLGQLNYFVLVVFSFIPTSNNVSNILVYLKHFGIPLDTGVAFWQLLTMIIKFLNHIG